MPEPPPRRPVRQQAAALRYGPDDQAPVVTAAGAGLLADRIVEAARAAGIPVRHDPALAQSLAALQLGTEVPEPLWRAVAETLAWAYRLEGRVGPRG